MSIRHTEGRLVMSMEVEVATEDDFLTSPLGPVAFRGSRYFGAFCGGRCVPNCHHYGGGGGDGEREQEREREVMGGGGDRPR